MTSSRSGRATALAKHIPNVPVGVTARMQAHLQTQDFPERGMPAVLQDFYVRLEAAELPPELVTEEIYDGVATSRSRLRSLLKGLEMFAPEVPLAPAMPAKKRWDAWLNARYGKKPMKPRSSPRIGKPPEAWPDAWGNALPALDKTVRPYGNRLCRLGPKTRNCVVSAVGMLAESRQWAADRDVDIGTDPSPDIFEVFIYYLQHERNVSLRTMADYCERVRMFFLRAGLLEEAGARALAEIIGTLVEQSADRDPGKWQRLRMFRKEFTLADVLHKAIAAEEAAALQPAHTTAAFRLRQKAMGYALLVNAGDRQGDLRSLRIGVDLARGADGLWHHAIRQGKTRTRKELGPLWPGTSALIDAHLLGDRPGWMIDDRVDEMHGMYLLTLGETVLHAGFLNMRLRADFGISGHLIRTLINDLLRRQRPDALWASQHMLGHTDRFMQNTYRSDFAESGAVRAMDQVVATVDRQ